VPNWTFAHELGKALHRPARLPLPAPVLRLAGDFAKELLLGGQRVLPDKAEASGFTFRHETLASAFAAILGSTPSRRLGCTSGWVQAMRDVMPALTDRGHSGTPRSGGPGIHNALRNTLDSGLAPAARPGMTAKQLGALTAAATHPTRARARPGRRSGSRDA
jgi:hypothetical protein